MTGVTNIPDVAKLVFSVPANTALVAKLNGAAVASASSGTNTVCSLTVRKTGIYIIEATYDGTTLQKTKAISRLGKKYLDEFIFEATIRVSTHPYATLRAVHQNVPSGETWSPIIGVAGASGKCDLIVPTGQKGIWTVTADNGEISRSKDVNVSSYNSIYNIELLEKVPDITFRVDGTTYHFKGSTIDVAGKLKMMQDGDNWKMWIYTNATISFGILQSNVDIFAVGKGTGGGYYHYTSPNDYAGGGGTGGEIKVVSDSTLVANQSYAVTVGSSGSSFGDIVTVGVGGGAAGGSGGVTVDTGWSSETHPQYSYSSPGSGGRGQFAFTDESFDGVEYGHGGEGGTTNYSNGARGRTTGVYANPGAGGAGGGQSNNNPTDGKIGIIILRNSS